jgi:hypothetical protein
LGFNLLKQKEARRKFKRIDKDVFLAQMCPRSAPKASRAEKLALAIKAKFRLQNAFGGDLKDAI